MQDILFNIDEQEIVVYEKPSLWKRFKRKVGMMMFIIFVLPAAISAIGLIISAISNARRERRYKKVINKGLFWDTEYLIEKD